MLKKGSDRGKVERGKRMLRNRRNIVKVEGKRRTLKK